MPADTYTFVFVMLGAVAVVLVYCLEYKVKPVKLATNYNFLHFYRLEKLILFTHGHLFTIHAVFLYIF
jgi:hypothetical protein